MGNVLVSALLKYLEAHPDQVVELVEAAVGALIRRLKAPPAPAPAHALLPRVP